MNTFSKAARFLFCPRLAYGWMLAGAAALAAPGSVYAWDGMVSGTIAAIHSVPAAGNLDLRVMIAGQPTVCTAAGVPDAGFAYLNSTDANYKGTMAVLLIAFSMGKTVTVYTTKNASTSYCQIGYVAVSN